MNLIYSISKNKTEGIKLGIPKYPGFCIEHMPMSYTFVTKKCDLFKKKTNAINIFYELHLKMFKSFVNKNGYALEKDTVIYLESTNTEIIP